MPDITQIPPTAPAAPAKPVAQAAQPAAIQASPQLQTLAAPPIGTTLSGYIVNRDATGNPILRTADGDVPFTSDIFLPIGSDVTLKVAGNGTAPQAELLTVNGQPPAQTTASALTSPDVILGGAAQETQAAGTTASSTPAVTVTGTLISPSTEPSAQPLPAGSQLTLHITSVTAEPGATPTATEPPTQQATPAQYATYAKAATGQQAPDATTATIPSATATPASPATNGTSQGTVTTTPTAGEQTAASTPATTTAAASPATTAIAPAPAEPAAPTATTATTTGNPPPSAPNITPATPTPANTAPPPAQPAATPATASNIPASSVSLPPAASGTIAATVINNPASGETIVQTPLGLIQLQQSVKLPVGSTLSFTLSAVFLPETALATGEPTPPRDLALHWQSLQTLTSLLSGRDAETPAPYNNTNMLWLANAAGAEPTSATPSPATALMLFISAVSGGDFRSWIGEENARWLEEEGHSTLVKKAEGEFSTLGRLFTDPPAHQWQTLFFPIMHEGELQQARLFVKRDRKQSSNREEKEDSDTRFVVEIDLSQLGEMQMDGFVRRQENAVQFDMVIRSLTPLSADAQRDILQIYNATGELTGYKGGVSFQAVREFPVNPMEEILAHAPDVLA